jgi:hypothetical protein
VFDRQVEALEGSRKKNRINLHIDDNDDTSDDDDNDVYAFCAAVTYATAYSARMIEEPNTYQEAISGPDSALWLKAFKLELEAMEKNKVWVVIDKPAGVNLIGSKWVTKVKYKADGSFDKLKGRLVAKGYTQKHGIDYEETFAPVARMQTIRILFALSVQYMLILFQMDVNTAFLNGFLTEQNIYMEIPEGYLDQLARTFKCLKLLKSIYGLKQSPREWNKVLHEYLISRGLQQSPEDPCIYTKTIDNQLALVVAIYVDDIILGCPKAFLDLLKKEKNALSIRFEMTDMGNLNSFLGLQVDSDLVEGTVFISQARYINKMVENFGDQNLQVAVTPILSDWDLPKDTEPFHGPYLQALRSVMHCIISTRPDIAYAVGILSRYSSAPEMKHWYMMQRLLGYLKYTKDFGILYKKDKNLCVIGYSDADFGSDKRDFKSTSGYNTNISNGAVSWSSRKQSITAQSTMEAEYVALSELTKDMVWIRRLLESLGAKVRHPTTLMCDSKAAMVVAGQHGQYHSRSKHIGIKFHFIRDQIEGKIVQVQYVNTKDNVADIFTKGLPKEQHNRLRGLLGVCERPVLQSGSVGNLGSTRVEGQGSANR